MASGKNKATLTLAGDSSSLEKAIGRGVSSVEGMVDDVESAGRAMRTSAESFDAIGEGAGALDTRAMGFRDTITGVQDVMKGWNDDSLSMSDRLLTLGMGVGDLASGVENLAAPMLKTAATWVKGHATMAASTVASVARQVAAWITLGIQSTLAALKVAAAWLISIGPLLLVAAAIVALVVLIVKNWDTIKAVITRGWEIVKQVSLAVWNAISSAVSSAISRVTSAIQTGISIARAVVSAGWNLLKTLTRGAFMFIYTTITTRVRSAVTLVQSLINRAVGLFRGLPRRIGSALSTVASMITAPFRRGFGAIKGIWNSTIGGKGFSVPSWIPGIGGKSFKIPRLHTGGVFNAIGGQREGLALLRDGETVRTPEQEAQLAAARNNAQPAYALVEFRSSGRAVDDFLVEMSRRAIDRRGGRVRVLEAM